jgi:hypothetical protein
MPNNVNASEKLKPVVSEDGAITNLKAINDKPEMVCWSMLFTDEIVALVSSIACECMWFILAIAKANWKPIPMHTKIRLIIAIFGSLK